MLFGTVRKQPADPSFNLPARRRVIWEHAQDLSVFLRVSVIFNILFFLTLVIVGVVLYTIAQRPPFVVDQDQGYVYYRDKEAYKLRTELLRSFLKVTTESLLTYNPGDYGISGVEHLVYPEIVSTFTEAARKQADIRTKFNRRQIWIIREIRQYKDPKLPKFIAIPIRGEKVTYEEVTTADGLKTIKTSSEPTLLMTYLQQKVPSPENPWGLYLRGISEIAEKDKAKLYWDMSTPITDVDELAEKSASAKKKEEDKDKDKDKDSKQQEE